MKKILVFIIAALILFSCSDKVFDPELQDIYISNLVSGQTVSGTVSVKISVNDSSIKIVSLFIQSGKVTTKNTAPYVFSLDSTKYEGTISVFCEGYNESGGFLARSDIVQLVIDNTGYVDPDPGQ